jgi:hypothetical protein
MQASPLKRVPAQSPWWLLQVQLVIVRLGWQITPFDDPIAKETSDSTKEKSVKLKCPPSLATQRARAETLPSAALARHVLLLTKVSSPQRLLGVLTSGSQLQCTLTV